MSGLPSYSPVCNPIYVVSASAALSMANTDTRSGRGKCAVRTFVCAAIECCLRDDSEVGNTGCSTGKGMVTSNEQDSRAKRDIAPVDCVPDCSMSTYPCLLSSTTRGRAFRCSAVSYQVSCQNARSPSAERNFFTLNSPFAQKLVIGLASRSGILTNGRRTSRENARGLCNAMPDAGESGGGRPCSRSNYRRR